MEVLIDQLLQLRQFCLNGDGALLSGSKIA